MTGREGERGMGCIRGGSRCPNVASAVLPQALCPLPATRTAQHNATGAGGFILVMQQKLGEREFSGCVQSWQVQPVDGRRGSEEVTFSTAARRRPKVNHVSNQKIFLCCSVELIWKMVLVWHFGENV